MSRADQLTRTTLLFQRDLGVDDAEIVLHALAAPKIVLTAGDAAMRTRTGQVALLTAAMLIARSGQRVYVHALDVPLVGYQPPFTGRTLYEAIQNVRGELIDGNDIEFGFPMGADIAFVFRGQIVCRTPPGSPHSLRRLDRLVGRAELMAKKLALCRTRLAHWRADSRCACRRG